MRILAAGSGKVLLFSTRVDLLNFVVQGGREFARSKMATMVASAAGEVVGPRPGRAACSFKQGIVEMLLRSFINVRVLRARTIRILNSNLA